MNRNSRSMNSLCELYVKTVNVRTSGIRYVSTMGEYLELTNYKCACIYIYIYIYITITIYIYLYIVYNIQYYI